MLIKLMFNGFESQTDITVFDIGFDVLSKVCQIVFSSNELSSFIKTKGNK